MRHAKTIIKRLLGRQAFVPDGRRDVFLASYPRSGNTWLRAIIHYVESGREPRSLAELDTSVPDAHYRVLESQLMPAPRYVVKTHDVFRGQFQRAVYVVRNPLDALESHYRYIQKTDDPDLPIDRFARDAVCGRIWPGSWSEHVTSWTDHTDDTAHDVSTIRYEDLVAHRSESVETLARALGWADLEAAHSALRRFSVEKMKQLEATGNRAGLERHGANWFIRGGSRSDAREAIRIAAVKWRPEIIEIATKHGYTL